MNGLGFEQVSPTLIVPISLHNDVLEMDPTTVAGIQRIRKHLTKKYRALYKDFFEALIADAEYKNIVIVIVDSLHRYSPYLNIQKKLNLNEARTFARQIGDIWEQFLVDEILPNKDNIWFLHWDESSVVFPINNGSHLTFKVQFDKAVDMYVGARNKKSGKDEKGEARQLSEKYVNEECIVLLQWIRDYRGFAIAYLGEPNPAIKYICEHPGEFTGDAKAKPVTIITTLANYYVNSQRLIKMIVPISKLTTEKTAPFQKLFHHGFHLYDRNTQTLITLWQLYYELLNPILQDEGFDNEIKCEQSKIKKSELAVMHLRAGTFLESMAGSVAMVATKSKDRDHYYDLAIEELEKAISIARQYSEGKDLIPQLELNLFANVAQWKCCLFHYLNESLRDSDAKVADGKKKEGDKKDGEDDSKLVIKRYTEKVATRFPFFSFTPTAMKTISTYNWKRLCVVIAFVRANRGSPFQTSILSLLTEIFSYPQATSNPDTSMTLAKPFTQNQVYLRVYAERILLDLMASKQQRKSTFEPMFFRAEYFLFESMRGMEEWMRTYRYLDLSVLYLIAARFYLDNKQFAKAAKYSGKAEELWDKVMKHYLSAKWDDPQNQDFKTVVLLGKNIDDVKTCCLKATTSSLPTQALTVACRI